MPPPDADHGAGPPPETEATEPETTARGTAGEPIVLPIAVGAATGASWELTLPDGVEELDETPGERAPPGDAGSPTGARLVVRARRPGSYRIVARLVRPWSGDVLRTVVVRLSVASPG